MSKNGEIGCFFSDCELSSEDDFFGDIDEEKELSEEDFIEDEAEPVAVVPLTAGEWALVYELLQERVVKSGLEQNDSIVAGKIIDKMVEYHN